MGHLDPSPQPLRDRSVWALFNVERLPSGWTESGHRPWPMIDEGIFKGGDSFPSELGKNDHHNWTVCSQIFNRDISNGIARKSVSSIDPHRVDQWL